MRVEVPFSVEYLTPDAVPIDEVIDSLIAVRTMLREATGTLPKYLPALDIESVRIDVRRITHESPLREYFLVALLIAFQDDLTEVVPPLIEKAGFPVADNMETLVTVAVLIAAFYGAGFVKDLVTNETVDSPVKQQLNALIDELSGQTGQAPEEIRRILDERYRPKGKLHELARQAIRFFRPSKSQNNSPMSINRRRIEPPVISDIPQEYAFEEEVGTTKSRDMYDVELEIHAQDRDKAKTGWAALIPEEMEKRVPMKLVGDVTPDQLWQKDRVNADVTIVYKRAGREFVPDQIHIHRLTD